MNHYKIILTYKDEDGNFQTESLWAIKMRRYYKIDNIPFLAPNIALNDIVDAKEEEGKLYYERLIRPSGHSTIQIIIFDEKVLEGLTNKLITLGCSWEGSHLKNLIAVDVPPNVNYKIIKKYLKVGESEGYWSYKEACLAKL